MTVIDVNTGKYEGRKKMADTIRKSITRRLFTIAAQLRLRNLSGIIMVDFIDMEQEEDKKALLDWLKTGCVNGSGPYGGCGYDASGAGGTDKKKVKKTAL